MQQHKILFLSVSAGAGHTHAAQALCAYATHNGNIETLHLDVMDYAPKSFRKLYIDTYIKLVKKFPAVWGLLYKKTDKTEPDALLQKLRRSVERLNTRALTKAIATFSPDAVICTHFLPAEILMHQINKGHFHAPVWVQVTDFDLHRMWVMPHMQGYFVANTEVAFRLQHMGIAAEHIHITGIPIKPAFAAPQEREKWMNIYGLRSNAPVLLLMGGGAGLGGLANVTDCLLRQDPSFQLIVLAGNNKKELVALHKMASSYPNRLFPQGFTHSIEQLMSCADLVITKPGGLTSSECLALGLPMIIHAPIPGQEEHNADYLLEQGVALKAVDELGLAYRIKQLLNTPEQLKNMQHRAKKLGRPLAAAEVLALVIQHLHA